MSLRKMDTPPAPVPIDAHYQLFKEVEQNLLERLSLLDKERLLIGMRVAYDLVDSPNEPDVLPYSIEFGYLGSADSVRDYGDQDPVFNDELWGKTTVSKALVTPLPLEMLDNLHDEIKKKLEELAGQKLRVGLFVVLYGSPTESYGVVCACNNPPRRRRIVHNNANLANGKYCSNKRC